MFVFIFYLIKESHDLIGFRKFKYICLLQNTSKPLTGERLSLISLSKILSQSIAISSGYPNTILWIGWIQQQTFISHSSEDWKSKIKVWVDSWLVDSCLLAACLHILSSVHKHGERNLSLPLLITALVP